MNHRLTLEACVYSLDDAVEAERGGADRVELCASPADGGITPSYGTMDLARKQLSLTIYPIIRPRGGDFLYSAAEFEVMKYDISMCKSIGVDGVVFGVLRADGSLDVERCSELVENARPLGVTVHRAFDMARDAEQTLEELIAIGVDRVLTSGQATSALQGIPLLARLVRIAAGRIIIMPGGGVSVDTVVPIVEQTGVREVHASAKVLRDSAMEFRRAELAMGTAAGAEFTLQHTSAERLRAIRTAAEAVLEKVLNTRL